MDSLLQEETIPLASWRHGFHEYDPRMAESWAEHKDIFLPDFVRWFEENVVRAGTVE